MMRKISVTAVSIIFLALLSACGYHFSGEGDGPQPGLRLIAIPVFENKTSEPDLGAMFAGALRQEFMRKGNMRVVPVEEAQAVFKGSVTNIYISPVAHNAAQNIVSNRVTLENRVYLTVSIRCEDKKTGKVLWQDPQFQYYKVYRLSEDPLHPDPLAGFENRREALEFLSREMSTRIHDRFLSNF